ncbi:hypothetical protein BGW38_003377 [Lunasporangiospora selenospora]|uniref:N-acetyltransferase domain-containing protein n=1 Tax=Lunasporangiospora selenospora TaxID=979761 RepID=A0A9P6KCR1_9FUNG|nr:hypothetical protein BGW38_003377 [Lunasporangiospora selenospora]
MTRVNDTDISLQSLDGGEGVGTGQQPYRPTFSPSQEITLSASSSSPSSPAVSTRSAFTAPRPPAISTRPLSYHPDDLALGSGAAGGRSSRFYPHAGNSSNNNGGYGGGERGSLHSIQLQMMQQQFDDGEVVYQTSLPPPPRPMSVAASPRRSSRAHSALPDRSSFVPSAHRASILSQQPSHSPSPHPSPLQQQHQHPSSPPQQDPRTSGYQETPQMQHGSIPGPRPASIDESLPPSSPLPQYMPPPPMAMQPPRYTVREMPNPYYHEIHFETQAAATVRYRDSMDDRMTPGGPFWLPGQRQSHRHATAEDDILFQAGAFNPEAADRGRKKKKGRSGSFGEEDSDYFSYEDGGGARSRSSWRRGECWMVLKDLAECCPFKELILAGLAERWGDEFDPSYNQDVVDIHGYYVQRHRATVVVLEANTSHHHQDNSTPTGTGTETETETSIVGCAILLPLPAEDVYDTWCAEPPRRWTDRPQRECRMMRLSIDRGYRGQGYAKAIIQHLMESARAQGFEVILVETENAWTSAVEIYKRQGFRVVASTELNTHYEYGL